jgi:hypothetical protein
MVGHELQPPLPLGGGEPSKGIIILHANAGKSFICNHIGIRDAAEPLLASPQDQLTRWQEYFKNNLAARLQQMSTTTMLMTSDTLKIPSGAPTETEIKTAIKHLQ